MKSVTTKSCGIRLPADLYNWIDRMAARRRITRSQYVHMLVHRARIRGKATPVSPPWTVKAAWAGIFFCCAVITVAFECIFGLI